MPEHIPGTIKVSLTASPIKTGEELFCFSILNPTDAQYLENFVLALDQHLPEIILPRNAIEEHEKMRSSGLTCEDILVKARRYLQKTNLAHINSSGELGQILLHLFASKVLKAHKLVSKFFRRESPTASYRGLDSLYAYQDENGNVYMLAGEAKMYSDSKAGLEKAYDDLNAFWENENKIAFEVSIASDTILEELTPENVQIFRSFFIPDHADHQRLKYKNVIFVGYNSRTFASLISRSTSQEDFVQLLNQELERCLDTQRQKILECEKVSIYCFLPFEAVDRARQVFAEHNSLLT